ncbi:MAG TPA: heme-binding protein [Burkholderiales bacterium]|nr:heme-binding protein [Burkholderiales bacterium]
MKRALVLLAVLIACAARAADGTFSVRILTPETALKASQAALKSCRDRGFQVTVAVVDRMGVVQALLRDRFAGPHTIDMAAAKAYTAVSFRTDTTELAEASQPGRPSSGIRHRPGVAAVGGGMMIEAGGSLLGAIGVSGAPGAREDDACAAAGIEAIREDIEL